MLNMAADYFSYGGENLQLIPRTSCVRKKYNADSYSLLVLVSSDKTCKEKTGGNLTTCVDDVIG